MIWKSIPKRVNSFLIFACFLLINTNIFSAEPLNSVDENLQPDRFIQAPNLPYESVAASDDITALYYNPAGLGMHPLQIGYFYGKNPDFDISDHTMFLNVFGLAFSSMWRFAPENQKATKYSFGTGFSVMDKSLSLGTSYSWMKSTSRYLNNYYQWDLGFILRPYRLLSFGLVGRSLNRPTYKGEELRARWDMGIAIRPFYKNPEFLTLSVDGTYFPSETFEQIAPKYTMEIVPLSGFAIYGNIDNNINYAVGIRFSQEFFQFSMQGNIPKEKGEFYSGGFLYGIERFPSKVTAVQRYLIINMNKTMPERKNDGSLFVSENTTFYEILNGIKIAEKDPRIKGVILKGQSFPGGWGQAEELRNALIHFKNQSGKSVVAHIESASNKEYFIATSADKIIMPPAGSLAITGLKAELIYIKDLFDKVGIEADFVQSGNYKTYPNMFNKSKPTTYEEEQTKSILVSLDRHIKESIFTARKLKEKDLNEQFEKGLFMAHEAKSSGLIDEIAYFSDVEKEFSDSLVRKFSWKVDVESYVRYQIYDDSWGLKKRIAVIVVDGEITSGPSKDESIFQTNSTGSDSMKILLENVKGDASIKAVVIRVNSPGGSGLASDIIWKEISSLKKAGKYVVVSIGDVAASGGYYISVAGDKIVSNETSIIGSIGVFGGKFSLKGLYEKLGVNKFTYKMNSKAALWSENDTFSDEERKLMQEHINEFYQLFLHRVKSNRKMSIEELEKHAGGRVYTGASGMDRKMVDHMGGLMLAIEIARQKANISEEDLEIIQLPRSARDLLDMNSGAKVMLPYMVKKAISLYHKSSEHKNDYIYFMMPYVLKVE